MAAAAAVLVTALPAPWAAGPAGASTGPAPGAVEAVADPGVTLAVPADGRVNGYRFAGHVLGAAVGPAVPALGIRAAAGQRLWVFGLRWTADQVPDHPGFPDNTYSPAPITAAVVYAGQRSPVPLTQPPPSAGTTGAGTAPAGADSGPEYFVASVPADTADVVVEMSSGGYAQDFSLTHMAREGPQPAALYRQDRGWQTVADLQAEKDLPTPYTDGSISLPDAQLIVKLPDVSLSYFGPGGPTDPAPGTGQAWLVPDLQDPVQNPGEPGHNLEYRANVTAADMTLTLADGTVIHPTTGPGGPDPQQWATDGSTDGRSLLFPYRYAFPVPAGLTAATLSIAFPPETAVAAYSGSSGITVNPGTATFPITLPPPSSPGPAPGAASAPAPIRADTTATRTAAPNSRHAPSPSSAPIIAVLVAAAAVGLALAWLILRRRRAATPHFEAAPLSGAEPAAADEARPGTATAPAPATHAATDTDTPDAGTTTTASPAAEPAGPVPPRTARESTPPPARLIDIPEAPRPTPGEVRILVLGPVILVGWPDPAARPGQTALELLTFLALHPGRQFSAEQLRNAIGRGRTRDVDAATIRRYIGELRRVLGDRVPEIRRGGGYQVVGVASDAVDFAAHLERARTAGSPEEQAGHLGAALALVRAAPFVDSVGEAFGWVNTGEQVAAQLANRILAAAVDLADLALAAGDSSLAEWAAGRGSLVWPGDEALDERALRAAALAVPSRLEQTWSALGSRLVAGEKLAPSPRLRALYDSLRLQPAG